MKPESLFYLFVLLVLCSGCRKQTAPLNNISAIAGKKTWHGQWFSKRDTSVVVETFIVNGTTIVTKIGSAYTVFEGYSSPAISFKKGYYTIFFNPTDNRFVYIYYYHNSFGGSSQAMYYP